MTRVTIQVIEGLERGHVYPDLVPPITIGREDDNAIRLNDERVSRFHAKIQEDNGRLILTDLDSTNGTRVNGHPVQMRVLQVGDQVSIGRCLMIYGSREQIVARAEEMRREATLRSRQDNRTVELTREGWDPDELIDPQFPNRAAGASQGANADPSGEPLLFPQGAPPIPTDLRPVQRAEVSDVIAFIHEQLRLVMQTSVGQEEVEGVLKSMQVDWANWQRLVGLEMSLVEYLRKLADPDA